MSLISTLLLGTGSLLATSFFNYSPYSMETSAPVQQWADAPIPLVATPQHSTGKVGISLRGQSIPETLMGDFQCQL